MYTIQKEYDGSFSVFQKVEVKHGSGYGFKDWQLVANFDTEEQAKSYLRIRLGMEY